MSDKNFKKLRLAYVGMMIVSLLSVLLACHPTRQQTNPIGSYSHLRDDKPGRPNQEGPSFPPSNPSSSPVVFFRSSGLNSPLPLSFDFTENEESAYKVQVNGEVKGEDLPPDMKLSQVSGKQKGVDQMWEIKWKPPVGTIKIDEGELKKITGTLMVTPSSGKNRSLYPISLVFNVSLSKIIPKVEILGLDPSLLKNAKCNTSYKFQVRVTDVNTSFSRPVNVVLDNGESSSHPSDVSFISLTDSSKGYVRQDQSQSSDVKGQVTTFAYELNIDSKSLDLKSIKSDGTVMGQLRALGGATFRLGISDTVQVQLRECGSSSVAAVASDPASKAVKKRGKK